MRGLKRSPGLTGLGVLLVALVAFAGHARADIASDQSGSLIIFPKVIADGSRDTWIQIANTTNSGVQAHCFYINAAGACSVTGAFCDIDEDCPSLTAPPVSQVCVHVCRELDFDILLTPQQPTIWPVSIGRAAFDGMPGIPPSVRIPPPPQPFVGELKCVQVDRSGFPAPGNALKGEAVIVPGQNRTAPDFGLLSEYNAISVIAGPNAGGSGILRFGPGQFNACPEKLIVPHYAEGATDGFTGATVSAELSLVACTELLEPQVATYSNANMLSWDEFEQQFSAPLQFGCSVNRRFNNIPVVNSPQFSAAVGGSLRKTTIRPQAGFQCYSGSERCHICGVYGSANPGLAETDPKCASAGPNALVGNCSCDPAIPNVCPGADPDFGCKQSPGLLGVVEEFYTSPSNTATAAINIYNQGSRPGDVIVMPALPQD